MEPKPLKVGIYARVSTKDQQCEGQLHELRRYVEARGWMVQGEYVDLGFSAAAKRTAGQSKPRLTPRPALDRLMTAARKRELDCIVVTKLDRWARSMPHFITSLQELDHLGVRWVAVDQGIDTDKASPGARLLMNIIAAVAEFEQTIISERTLAGLAQAKRQGRIGGKKPLCIDRAKVQDARAAGASLAQLAKQFGISRTSAARIVRGQG